MTDVAQPEPLIASWQVPLVGAGELRVDARAGEVITVVGANGSGKSALATWIARNTPGGGLHRVLAQRRIWFQNAGPDISASGRERLAGNLEYWNTALDSRFVDHADGQRTDIALFDLLGMIAAEDHRIAELSQRERFTPDEIDAIVGTRLFDILNSVLERAGLLVSVTTTDRQTFAATHRGLGNSYPISQMSDGERSALLLAAEILVAPVASVVMLDEPERHLHRSISAGLIEALIDVRADCAFVVLTHDLDLALGLSARSGRVLSALGVEWSDSDPVRWALEEITANTPMTEAARRGILGGRSRVLFIEGTGDSLDIALYGALFPEWTLSPSGSCEWVIRNVEGVNKTDSHHWVQAIGIIDGDGRSDEERAALRIKGVHPLLVNEVESLFYLPVVLNAVACKQAAVDGEDAEKRASLAMDAGVDALAVNDGVDRAARKLATDEVVRRMVSAIPSEITDPEVCIRVISPYSEIKRRLEEFHAARDYENLVREVSVRDSGFRHQVAKALGFDSYRRYEKAALVSIVEDRELAACLGRQVLGSVGGVSRGGLTPSEGV